MARVSRRPVGESGSQLRIEWKAFPVAGAIMHLLTPSGSEEGVPVTFQR